MKEIEMELVICERVTIDVRHRITITGDSNEDIQNQIRLLSSQQLELVLPPSASGEFDFDTIGSTGNFEVYDNSGNFIRSIEDDCSHTG